MRQKKPVQDQPKAAPILAQMGIFAAVLFVSSLISPLFPASFPVPTPVIGLILLYLLLTFHVIKLEWVDGFGSFLIGLIAFLFVPSGISLATSLDIMAKSGVQIVTVVIISTVLMLVITAYTARLLIFLHQKLKQFSTTEHRQNKTRLLLKKGGI
ncbi:CidA/LrgA family protein [Loigolactobacillus bifermentans]|uniref:Effector of murein hydrolase LrgA n=1 Tax=Loigolactobacillus bifermentans DSM 20003 TaxID=1423726 RepID=A0A0R1GQW7_9LACO|nr:CidA/LrgA family protein [Loigolactobacillus bifermentans]KRK36415.1 effector of murein hydrolase LrgA [Loigolactobacillus bifermentans DSM 20003]QGG60643.1 murein hydrolase regulator LrgA [Loigolactobacillus bifermentans]